MPPSKKTPSRTKSGAGPSNKQWRDALRLELARADGPTGTALERIARIVVHDALNGDYVAINEIANRIDGKVAVQEVAGDAEPIQKLVVSWAGPAAAGKPEAGTIIEHQPSPVRNEPVHESPAGTAEVGLRPTKGTPNDT